MPPAYFAERTGNLPLAVGPILIIEDNAVVREGLAVILRRAGYTTAAAMDGRAALEYLRQGPEPALILLDMFLPVMDGWQVLQELRKHGSSPPVIITTGSILTREWAAQNGCQGFLHKPIEERALLREIKR